MSTYLSLKNRAQYYVDARLAKGHPPRDAQRKPHPPRAGPRHRGEGAHRTHHARKEDGVESNQARNRNPSCTEVPRRGLPGRKRTEGHNNGLLHFQFEESQGRCGLESIVLRPEKLGLAYDKKSDVLYISAGKPREADDSIEPQEGVVIRTRKGELVGITIIGLKSRDRKSVVE